MTSTRQGASAAPETDVIVVGAGPAGSIAALMLARAGLAVRLLDRSQFPRDKLCGDTLNPGSLSILDAIDGCDQGTQDLSGAAAVQREAAPAGGSLGRRVRARALAVTGMTVTGPGAGVSADYPTGMCGAAMTRRDLDALLLDAAAGAGVRFEPGLHVQAPVMSADALRVIGVRASCGGRQHLFRARIVIAADGRGSRLASALGLSRFAPTPRRWAFGAYFSDVDAVTSRGEMHVRAGVYIGIAPVPGGLTNVCVVRAAPAGGAPRLDQQRVIEQTVSADALLRERFAWASRQSPVSALGPLAVESAAAGCPGLLLAGDAGGFVDPITGDGLRFALRGGQLAADAALRELDHGVPAFTSLGAARRHEFAAKWRINRVLRTIVGSPRSLTLAARVTSRWPTPVALLIGIAGDVALARRG